MQLYKQLNILKITQILHGAIRLIGTKTSDKVSARSSSRIWASYSRWLTDLYQVSEAHTYNSQALFVFLIIS